MNTSIQQPAPYAIVQPSSDSSQSEVTLSAWRNPGGPFPWVAWLAGLVFLLFSAPAAHADRSPPGCLGSGLGISLFTSLPDVHIGDTIFYSVNVFNAPFPACDAGETNPAVAGAIHAYVVTPDGVTNNLTLRRTYLAPGESDFYTNVVSYVVRAQDIGPDGTVRATAVDQGDIHQNDVDSTGGGNQGVNTQVNLPCVLITAQCVAGVGENGAISFTGTVTNCGNNTLVGVTVTNFNDDGFFTVLFPTNLAIRQVAPFSGSWIPSNPCAPSTAILTVLATDQFTATPRTLTNFTTLTCQNTLTPGIKVTKACPAQPVAPGQLFTFSGSVSNTGNVTLTNIVVVNDQPAPNTPVFNRPSLAPGEVVSFTGSYPAPVCCSAADTVTATGTSRCGVKVSDFASATCPLTTAPAIAATLSCPATPIVAGGVVTYTGTVSNSGNASLDNVTVVQSGQPVPSTSGLVGYWAFNETSGSLAIDSSGSGNDGNIINATRGPGQYGNGLSFNGTNAYVDITNNASVNFAGAITMAAWIKPQAIDGYRQILAHGYSLPLSNSVFLRILNGNYQAGASGGTAPVLTVAVPAGDIGTWVHLAATFDGSTWILYRNGVAIGSNSAGTAAMMVNANWAVGARGGGGERFFKGMIDEARLYNRALSGAEVTVLSGTSSSVLFSAANLAPGASGTFALNGVAGACSATATVIATGQGQCPPYLAVTNTASATCPVTTAPAIAVTLACPAVPVATGGQITYTGTVRNSGDVTLNNVTVVDSQSLPSTVLTVASLAPGASANFTASFTAPADACSVSSTVTARGTNACTAIGVSTSASTTCPLVTAPRIAVTQNCPANPPSLGGVLTYSGTVSNAGNITLTNVVVTNDHTGASPVFTVATLAPGASTNFTGSYTVPTNNACAVSSTVMASGNDKCTAALVTANATAACPVQGAANLALTLACPATPTPLGGLLTFSGTVRNAGNITVTNVVVRRDAPAPGTVVFSVASLAPGASANFTGSYTVPGSNACSITTSLSASANDQCAGSGVTARATTDCPLVTTPRILVTQGCPTNPPSPGGVLIYSGTVSNAGNITLTNITVVNNQRAPDTNTSSGPATFGTIFPPLVPPAGTFTDRFVVGNNFNGLTYADQDEGYAATQFYSLRHEVSGTSSFVTINAGGTVAGRFDAGNKNFDALTFAAPDVGYGPVIFYYLRHDSTGVSSFGTIKPGGAVGVVADLFVVGNNFDALTFAATDVGYGANLFYYLRHDNNGSSTFGTINPALPGTVTDLFSVGSSFDALVFTATDVGYGADLFYYLRHDSNGRSTFGTISATGTVTDRFSVGTNFTELTFTTTDVGFGANLFYYLRAGGSTSGTNTTTQPAFTLPSLAPGASANFTGSYTVPNSNSCSVSAIVTATATDICSGNTVTNTITTTCPLATTPRIAVTLACPAVPVATGGQITYTGTVRNSGDVTLNNVTVVDSQSVPSTVLAVAALAPGASANFTASFTAPADACSVSTTVTARGTNACTAIGVSTIASATCPLVTAPRIAVTQSCPANPPGLGGVLTYSGTVSNAGNITLTNVVVTNDRTGSSPVFTVATLAPGALMNFTGSYTVPTNSACAITSTLTATGNDNCTAMLVTANATATCPVQGAANIALTLACPATPTPLGGLLSFTGTVRNTGNLTVTNVVVRRDAPAPGTVIFSVASLPPGASANFTGSYTVAATNACSITTSVSASAGDTCTGVLVAANASITCPLVTTPAIEVTQVCPVTPVLPGGILTYSGSVSNAGNITLTNIVVVNNRPAPNSVIFTAVSLAPGATTNFAGSYEVPLNCCVVWSTVITTGNDTCTGVAVTDSDTEACTVLTLPKLVVTKVCPPTAVRPGDVLQYSGTVSNAGNIVLIDVTIVNTQPSAGSPVWGPITLAPGESVSYYASYVVAPDFCGGTDTVTARGLDACTLAPVVSSVTTTCPILTTPRIAVTKNCPAQPTPRGGMFTFTGTVSNPGNVTLVNVLVVNNYQVDCFSRTNGPVIGPITLAPGASVNFTGSYTAPLSCCEVIDTLTASGQDRCSSSNVTATATAVCPLLTTPRIAVVQNCPAAPIPMGSVYTFSGYVTNTGDAVLTNVFVFSPQGTNTPALGPIELAPGESEFYFGSYTVPSNTCSVSVTARGQDICGGNLVINTAGCPVATTPGISITESCPPGPVSAGSLVVFEGSVTNTGNISLTNVLVFSSSSNSTPVLGPITLAPGASAPFAGSYIALGGSSPTTNSVTTPTTNTVITYTTNMVITYTTNRVVTTNTATANSFGTINTLSQAVVDRFVIGPNFEGLTYDASDAGYGATEFYSMRQDNTGASFFNTIIAGTAAVTDRFNASNRSFDALTYAAPDVGYGPLLFYYLTHDNAGVSTLGSITPGGTVGVAADHFVVGNNFDALTFAATDVGYGANMFYYVRHDATGLSTFGTINPALPGTITDRFAIGANVDALCFTDLIAPGYGANNFYYLRHGANGVSTFGTILVTGLANATVTDRFPVGTNATELTFTATDVGFGPNLFYFLRGGGGGITTNIVTTPVGTNIVTTPVGTNTVITYTTHSVVTFTPTNTVTVTGMDICQTRAVTAAANCLGPVGPTPAGPVIGALTMANGSFSLSFHTENGKSYTVQYKNTLSDPAWTDLQTIVGTGGIRTITNALSTQQPTRFYRVMATP